MTNLEAADLLDNLIGMVSDNHDSDYDEALSKGRDILKSEPCEDAINRQAAIHCLEQLVTDMPQLKLYAQKVADAMSDLPYVYPKQKTGYWINEPGRIPKCSECGIYSDDADKEYDNYCPNCGAKMIESEG